MTPEEVFALAREADTKFVDLKFTDLLGQWQHLTVPVHELNDDLFEDGHGFDGSSIRGWQKIDASDMLLIPDPSSAKIDPFVEASTLSLVCDVVDPITREPYQRGPRSVARRAEAFLKGTGIADVSYFGPEAEFFVFDRAVFHQDANSAYYEVDSEEGIWNSGTSGRGHLPKYKGGYFPVAPIDAQMDLRNEMARVMGEVGIQVETIHHEVATGGQAEIDIRFAPLLEQADNLQWFKYIVKGVADAHGKTATFMPKPLFGDNGSGMHTHISLWKGGKPLFAGDQYGGFSQLGLHFIGGLLLHAPALCALTNPTTNSYKRLVPGFEAPNKLAYSARNRSAACRIPMYSMSPKAKRVEYRTPDPTANPYLAFAAMLMAGLDGVINKIDPGPPLDKNIYDLPPEEAKQVRSAPGSLEEALDALEADHTFLLRGDVFSLDLIEAWIAWKRDEVAQWRQRPTPWEFSEYFSA